MLLLSAIRRLPSRLPSRTVVHQGRLPANHFIRLRVEMLQIAGLSTSGPALPPLALFQRVKTLLLSSKKGQWGLLGKRKSGGNDAESAASRARTGESKGGGGGGGGGKTDGPEFSGGRKLTPRDLLIPTALLLALQYFGSQNQGEANRNAPRDISMQFFLTKLLAVGEVDRVEVDKENEAVFVSLVEDAIIEGLDDGKASNQLYRISIGSISSFERQLEAFQKELGFEEKDFVGVRYRSPDGFSETLGEVLSALVPLMIFGAVFLAMSRRSGGLGGLGKAAKKGGSGTGSGPGAANDPFAVGKISAEAVTTSGTRFTDVAGLGEAKVEVMEFVEYLRNPSPFETLGAKVPRGALLTGPPGTGKTLLAKAVAGEANVPFYSVSGSDFVEMFVGVGASRVRDLFKKARENKPSIVYIDEIDAVGKARGSGGGGGNQERESTLNQLLVEMDGFGTEEGIIILASTNRADTLDKALLRPGRFDRQISCDLPTLDERKEIFDLYLRKIKLDVPVDDHIPKLAALTPGMSPAQIANICNEAALFAARRGAKAVQINDFAQAADRVVAGSEKKSRVMSFHEKEIVAYHESGHVLTAWLLQTMDPLLKTTIIPRTSGALGFAQYMPSDKHLHSQEELEDRLVVMLGGRAAEQTQFNSITTGASDDLKRVSDIAYAMLTQYGMSPTIGNLAWDLKPESGYRSASNALTQKVEAEVNQMVRQAYNRSISMLEANKDKLGLIAEELLIKETLDYDDVERLIGARPFPHEHPYKFTDVEPPVATTTAAAAAAAAAVQREPADLEPAVLDPSMNVPSPQL